MQTKDTLVATTPRILSNRVMESFFRRVLQEDRPINSLTIVSPWISHWDAGYVGLAELCNRIDLRRIRTLVLTRPPTHDWHKEAIETFNRSPFVNVWLLPDLHAKIFVCEAVPVGFGLVGSANLTAKSLSNFEIAVMFDGRGIHSPLIKELKTIAWHDLRRYGRKYS